MKKFLLASLVLFILIIGFFSVNKVYAADTTCEQQCAGLKQIGTDGTRSIAGESYKCCMTTCANKSTEFGLCIGIDNPLGQKKDVKDILASIITTVIQIVLPIVVLMVIYSGFLYVLARGKPEAIERAHKTLTWTLVGAAILLGAQLIANVLIDTISKIGDDSGYNSKTVNVDTGSGVGTGTGTGSGTGTGTCTDGIKNGDETGIDTGGRCGNVNDTGTCTDGIKNGDETGIDTGGRCTVDIGTCTDGIKNGDETGVDAGGRCTTNIDPKTEPSYILNLKAVVDESKEIYDGTKLYSPVKFTYDVSQDFTPDAGTYFLTCLPNSEINKTFPSTSMNIQLFSDPKKAELVKKANGYVVYDATSTALYIKDTHVCTVSYKLSGNLKSASTTIKVPAKTYGGETGNSLTDPLGGSDFKLDNGKIGVEIKKIDVANNSVDYEVIIYDYKDFTNLGMTCVNKNAPTTLIMDNFNSTVKRDGNSTLRAIFKTDALKGMTLTDVYCAVEFELKSDTYQRHSTYAFPLVVGNGNTKKYLGY